VRFPAALLVATLACAAPALADCSDSPRRGVDWRNCSLYNRDFSGADLREAEMTASRLTRTEFGGADLSGADLRRAKLMDAKAKKARFDDARLNGADLTNAELEGASFRNADLRRAQLQGANLREADLTGAQTDEAGMLRTDLSGARWIDGRTICAEGSISQCRRGPAGGSPSG